MELRNYFSLFCLHQETQLIFTYLPITSHILGAFVNSQVQGHREVRPLDWNPSAEPSMLLRNDVSDRTQEIRVRGDIMMKGECLLSHHIFLCLVLLLLLIIIPS